MKKLLLTLALILVAFMGNAQETGEVEKDLYDQEKDSSSIRWRTTKVFGNQKIEYTFLTNDGVFRNFEKVYMRYANSVGGGKVNYLNGLVIAICGEKKSNGEYLMAFRMAEDGILKKGIRTMLHT